METQATALGQESEAAPAVPENPFLSEGTPAPQEAASEETPSPEAAEPEAETPWYHSVESDDNLFEHEKFTGRRDALKENALAEGRLQAQQELTPLLEGSGQEFAKLTQQMRSLLGRLNKAANDGALDETAVSNLMTDHGEAFAALNRAVDGEYPKQMRQVAYGDFLTALAQDMNDFQLAGEFAGRLPYASRGMDKKFIPDLRKRIVAKVAKEEFNNGYQKGLKENRAAKAALDQTQEAAGTGANLAPGSPAGGKSDAELLADPQTPINKLIEIRARQKAGQ